MKGEWKKKSHTLLQLFCASLTQLSAENKEKCLNYVLSTPLHH